MFVVKKEEMNVGVLCVERRINYSNSFLVERDSKNIVLRNRYGK